MKRICFAKNAGEREMEKLFRSVNKKRASLDLPQILTDGCGNPIRQTRKGKFVKY